jgi:hypothetical protein
MRFPSVKKAIADGYQAKPTADEVKQQAGIPLEIVGRTQSRAFMCCPSVGSLSTLTDGLVAAVVSPKTTRTSPAAMSGLSSSQ